MEQVCGGSMKLFRREGDQHLTDCAWKATFQTSDAIAIGRSTVADICRIERRAALT